ncbi:DUF6479 family protein [Streptomyces sp. NPDC003327]
MLLSTPSTPVPVALDAPASLAADSGSFVLPLVGVPVVILLILAFWWGSRRVARRRRPTSAAAQPPAAQARQDSWDSPEERPNRH